MDYKKVELLQNIWDVTTNIIGYSLIAVAIIAGLNLGYWGSTVFTVFCIAAAVYFFSKYYYFPYVANDWSNQKKHKTKIWCVTKDFTSFLGNGEVLYGNFGNGTGYCFLSICYIPLIPIGCYTFYGNRKMIQITSDPTEGDVYWVGCLTWNRKEILYIYMKNWSFA